MPTSNIFYAKSQQEKNLQGLASKLKPYLAEKLTCGQIKLKKDEISVRLINVDVTGMIGEVEVEITAFAYPERVKNQDRICLDVRDYIMKEYPSLGEVKVWLILAELGHSWEK
jgi:hypothetical protein